VTLLVFLEQDSPTASEVRFAGARPGGPFAASITARKLAVAIADLRGRGMSAGILPLLGEPSHARRQFFRPADRRAWFASYGAALAEIAEWAERQGVDELCAGSELSLLFQDASGWRGVIAEIRRAFRGHVTVCATWPDYELVRFWDACDSIGVSAYFPLALFAREDAVPQLERSWRLHRLHLSFMAALWRKPITFVEVGYPATPVAAARPWDFDFSRSYDPDRQAACFEAFRRVWSRDPLLRRFEIWGLSPAALDRLDSNGRGFVPFGKAAESTVRRLFEERARG
jgi:hypothetical protein